MVQNSLKDKIIALFTVAILFAVVGSLFYFISLDNKNKTTALRNLVIQLQRKKEITNNFKMVQMATSTLSGITSRSFLTIAITEDGQKKVIAERSPNLVLPIASITKLMVAVITMENIDPETEVKATLDYIGKEESAFILETDKKYTVRELLTNSLVSSDNDSARLLSSTMGEVNFIAKMNNKASELGLTNTSFVNVTGLDPAKITGKVNMSTATDLANLLIYIKNNYPEILKITAKPQYNFCDINGYCKMVLSTDKLINDDSFKYKIIGGKTGSTDLALKNLAIIISPINGIYIVNIVLGATDNFADTRSIINNIIYN